MESREGSAWRLTPEMGNRSVVASRTVSLEGCPGM